MQNLLNWADRASTLPNRSSNEFLGKNGALPAQTMTIPVTTGVNRDATVLNLGLYRPITGVNRGGCIQRAWLITVETWTLRVSSRLNTVFYVGQHSWWLALTPSCFQHLRTTREWAGSTQLILVRQVCPLLWHDFTTVHPWSQSQDVTAP